MAACYEWADAYDSKDWKRLEKCIAPTLRVDYRSFLNKLWEAMPADEFVKMVCHTRCYTPPTPPSIHPTSHLTHVHTPRLIHHEL